MEYFASIWKELKNSSILIIFGVLRLISVKSTGYVEHESEYGKHWNFFFTIVFVKVKMSQF
jgi:phosphatidylinositol glycan class W